MESGPTSGSRFTVYWRARDDRGADRRLAAGEATGRDGGRTLLIVDDEPHLVALVEEAAASLGYEPVGFCDTTRALNAVHQDRQRFDAVITDENMPGLRGLALTQAIHEIRPELPVMLVTGYRTAELDRAARACGIQEIADKPVKLDDIKRLLERVLRQAPA